MLTARPLVMSAAIAMLLAGASYARGAPAESFSLSPTAIQVNPKRPNIVYASSLGDDTRPGGIFKSTDAGKTWSLLVTGLTNPASPTGSKGLRVDALALDPRSPNVLYAGTGLGVFKTIDGAKTWRLASSGIDFGGDGLGHRMLEGFIWAIAIDPLHTSTVYAAGGGLWKSTNGGATWKRVLRHFAVNVGIDPRRPETVYAGLATGRRSTAGVRGAILETVDGGVSWHAIGPRGLRDGFFGHPIVVDRRVPGTIYAGGSRGLFASANGGRTWRKLLSASAAERIDAIALDPARASVLYAGGWASGVMKSEDGGQTWSRLRLDMRNVTTIAIAPARPQTIYAGGDGIWKSGDGGATWRRLS